MLSKYSVKKPLTVFVVVIIVIVFGVVSFTRSTMDLYPKIDMPYVVVMTTDPGVAAEKIEKDISEPMESQLAGVQQLKTISSMSSDNFSLIMMEFDEKADMTSVVSDIREKSELASGAFDDSVQAPVIFRINPDIMPVVISAVTCEDMTRGESSEFIRNNIEQRVKGIDGVATHSVSGMTEDTIHVSIDQKKIDALNKRIKENAGGQASAVLNRLNRSIGTATKNDAELSEARKQLVKAQSTLIKNKQKIGKALSYIETLTLSKEMAEAIDDSQSVAAYEAELQAAKKQLLPFQSQLAQFGVDLDEAVKSSANATKAHDAFDVAVDTQQADLSNQISSVDSSQAYLKSVISQLNGSKDQVEQQAEAASSQADITGALTLDSVSQMLSAQNYKMPAGYVSDDGHDMLVTVGNEMDSISDVRNMVLFDTKVDGIGKIRVGDVAEVSHVDLNKDAFVKLNGKDGLLLTCNKQSDYSTTTVSDNIHDTFAKLEKEYKKEGLHFTVLFDQGDYIRMVIRSVLQNLLLGAVFAFLILLFFLRDIKATVVVAISIPISVTFAFVLMYFSGVTLNIISMAGLAVGVGMLVDNSIVVIENIYRLRREGMPQKKAAVAGAVQVAGAITASTLTTVCVFLPVVFVEGITRQIMKDMALTVTYSLVASLIVELTMLTSMASGLLKRVHHRDLLSKDSPTIGKYKKAARWALGHRAVVMLVVLVLLVGSVVMEFSRGMEFMPSMATEQITAQVSLPKDTTRKEAYEIYNKLGDKAEKEKGVKDVGLMLSQSAGDMFGISSRGSENDAYTEMSMYVVLDKKYIKRNKTISKHLEKWGEQMGCEMSVSGTNDMASAASLGGGGISIDVYSDNLDALRLSSMRIENMLRDCKGLKDVSDSGENTVAELEVAVDPKKAAAKGVTTAQVYAATQKLLSSSGTKSTGVTEDGVSKDVMLVAGAENLTKSQLLEETLTIAKQDGQAARLKLKDVASISEGSALTIIQRKEQKRSVNVTAQVDDTHNITKMTEKVQKKIDDMDLPDSVSVVFGGEQEAIQDAMKQLYQLLALAVLLIYLIMVAQFQSLREPLIIMFTVPLAFTGGALGLLLTGQTISIIAMVGVVMLSGVVVNNGIVLVDQINRLRREGYDKREAIVMAASMRMRPVLMTAATTVLGLIPVAFALGSGGEMIQQVGIVCIGGLLYATILTLLVVPVMYDLLGAKKIRKISEDELTEDINS